jgi:processive 1,2-diacylglycerol beta-glucosyltransferase/1,2-diacylglycerol 3-beta-galactosyltransferase
MKGEKITFLYLKTGGGHISAARALQSYLQENHGKEVETLLFDPVPEDAFFANLLLQDGYRFTSHTVRPIWILLYEMSRLKVVGVFWSFFIYLTVRKPLKRFIRERGIDKLVILHFLLLRPVTWVLRGMERSARPEACTIVTDPFTAHPLWFSRPTLPTVVFSERLAREAVRNHGFAPSRIRRFPLILKSDFEGKMSPEAIARSRQERGISRELRTVLFIGGGEGFPRGEEFLRAFLKSDLSAEAILVCGKDDQLKRKARNMAARHPGKRVHIFGFIDFVFELMNLCDIIVTKGGPATLMEALILEKPLIISTYLYGQEKGNVEFVVHNEAGFYAPTPAEVVEKIRLLTENEEVWREIRKNIRSLDIKNGTGPIAEYILSL